MRKVNFDFENQGVTDDGFANEHSSLPDGTEFIWCWAGGDWEKDVNFILYLDPNDKIRAYVPSKGNMYCHKCKCAWGTCECGATEPDYDKVDHDFAMMYADICKDLNHRACNLRSEMRHTSSEVNRFRIFLNL